jgi:putative transposase
MEKDQPGVKITQAHKDSDGSYGSPRITAELRDRGEVVTAKTVAKIMASIRIEGVSPRTFKTRTTVVDPTASFPPDLVDRVFDRGLPDAVWFTDITYLACGEGEMFLCAVRDGNSRKVLGYSISDHIGAEMVTDAIDAAPSTRPGTGPPPPAAGQKDRWDTPCGRPWPASTQPRTGRPHHQL